MQGRGLGLNDAEQGPAGEVEVLCARLAGRQHPLQGGDRTDETDESPTSHEETLAYYCELPHLAAGPGLRTRVSIRPREPGLRVEDWTWEARRVRSSLG